MAEVHRSCVAGGQQGHVTVTSMNQCGRSAVIRGNGRVISTFLDADHNDVGVV